MPDDDDYESYYDEWHDDDTEYDVCQHCGRYFAWSAELRKAWETRWHPWPGDHQPQRCMKCIVDDTWIE